MAEKDKKSRKQSSNAIAVFFRETTGELRKVTWPTWPEARRLTVLVLLVMIVMGIFLGVVDLIATQILNLTLGI